MTFKKRFVIIVAGGKGLRMGGDLPKQFLPIGGEPVLMHTLRAFHNFDAEMGIVLVLPVSQQSFWTGLCDKNGFDVPHQVVSGGETRFHSVYNGLQSVIHMAREMNVPFRQALVGVHDGVRPFVFAEVIRRCFEVADLKQAAVPVIPVVETVRELMPANENVSVGTSGDNDELSYPFSVTRPRDSYRLVQTPQVFNLELLSDAYNQPYTSAFTDDASVVEAYGNRIYLVEGNRENIKITTPFDLVVAEALISTLSPKQK